MHIFRVELCMCAAVYSKFRAVFCLFFGLYNCFFLRNKLSPTTAGLDYQLITSTCCREYGTLHFHSSYSANPGDRKLLIVLRLWLRQVYSKIVVKVVCVCKYVHKLQISNFYFCFRRMQRQPTFRRHWRGRRNEPSENTPTEE